MEKYRIGKVYISATSPGDAEQHITKAVEDGINDYICVSNVRTVAYANKDAAYREVMNGAFMCTPDGMPLVWMARLWGLKEVQRTVPPCVIVGGNPAKVIKTRFRSKDDFNEHFKGLKTILINN